MLLFLSPRAPVDASLLLAHPRRPRRFSARPSHSSIPALRLSFTQTYMNDFWLLESDQMEVNATTARLPLHLKYERISPMVVFLQKSMERGFQDQVKAGVAVAVSRLTKPREGACSNDAGAIAAGSDVCRKHKHSDYIAIWPPIRSRAHRATWTTSSASSRSRTPTTSASRWPCRSCTPCLTSWPSGRTSASGLRTSPWRASPHARSSSTPSCRCGLHA